MGGVKNTMQKGFGATKKVLSGKGNLTDFGEMATGIDFHNRPANPGSVDPNDPFTYNTASANADKAAIEAEGQRQYDQNLAGINEYGNAETKRAHDLFGQMLPDIAENSQAAHLYDSTGYGQEVARQQSNIASQIAENEAQQRMSALSGRQGFQTGGLQRLMGLQDFTQQAKVAKAIGATNAPQAPSSKATGSAGALAGAGAGAQAGTAVSPGYGTALGALIGAGAGYYGGSMQGKR